MTALARYDAAVNAIAAAKAVDELLTIHDKADALRAAARIAGNKQAEIDMAEIRFRAERRLGEMMADQPKATGGQPYQATGSASDPVGRPVSYSEVGIDKHLADRARKLAAIPADEFNGIVGNWRDRVREEGERVTVNLLKAGDRAQQGRRENDFYPTPQTVVAEIIARWAPTARTIWEPCVGDGRVAEALRGGGYEVVTGDIAQGNDFFAYTAPPRPGVALCTNPPFDRVREFIDHAFAIGIQEMCLVLPERLWACGAGREQFERHRPTIWANMDWREDYLGKGGSADRALAVAIWTSPHALRCSFDVWTRQSGSDAEAFDPETGEFTEPEAADVVPAEQAEPERAHAAASDAGEEQAQADASPVPPKPKNPFRPHCLKPNNCASSSPRAHCYGCQSAHAEANGETA